MTVDRHGRRTARLVRRRPATWRSALDPRARVWLLNAGLLAVAVVLFRQVTSATPPFAAELNLTWWQLTPVFTLAGIFVFHVEINSEAHTFSLQVAAEATAIGTVGSFARSPSRRT